jgi:hypothetical protein
LAADGNAARHRHKKTDRKNAGKHRLMIRASLL